jgi:drug/metabolite transporter (DMT)-like permease
MMLLGVTGGSLYFLAENEALNYTTATNTSLIVCSCPLVASALIGLFYKSERMSRLQTLGALTAVAGVCVVVLNGHFVLHLSPLGDALALAANLCWAFYSLLMIPVGRKYDSVFITRKVFFYGLVTIIPYYMLVPEETWIFTSSILQFFNFSILLNLLFLGVVASMLCFLAWTWVIKRLGAMVTTNYVYLNPVATIVFAWWILNEQITSYFLLGTVLILLGMYLADKKKA